MGNATLQNLVIRHLQDAFAMEQNVLGMLDSMIMHTDEPQMKQLLQNHRGETVQHASRLEGRLKEMGETTSVTKTAGAVVAGMMKMVVDAVRSEKPAKNLRDGFVTEYGEIAGYELLERFANRAGDAKTAEIARRNKRDEEEMARRLNDCWDRAVDLDLLAEGLEQDNAGQTGSFGARTDAAKRGDTWTGSSADADMGLGMHDTRSAAGTGSDEVQGKGAEMIGDANVRIDTARKRKGARNPGDDVSRAPEEEGSATGTDTKSELLNKHKTDESGAPVD